MQSLDEFINSVRHLPPAPKVVPELMKLLKESNIDSSRVVKLISLDPALTANVLRVCNSAYFGSAQPTTDLQEGVTRLGFQQVYQLVAAASGARLLSPAQKGYGFEQGDLWKHSIAVAVAAQLAAKNLGDDENLVFTAALLHDIGKIVLAQFLENKYYKLLQEVENHQLSLLESEKKLLGANHAEVGGRLLERWHFAPALVSSVWFHHSPKAATPHHRLASYIYLGDMVAHFMGYGYGHMPFALRGRTDALSILNLEAEAIPRLMIETQEQMNLMDALLAVAT